MAGVLFVVYIPRKEHEGDLKNNVKTNFINEKDKINKSKTSPKRSNISIENYQLADVNNIVFSKCKSTDCLHADDVVAGLYKTHSENNLHTDSDDSKSYMKTSWDEIKQVIKPRKNKLKINKPVRGVDIRDAFHSDTPLETILSEIVERLGIQNAVWALTKDNKFWQVTFGLESGGLCEELLQVLRTFGIGSRYRSSVSVVPCALFYKSNDNNTQSQAFDEKNKYINSQSSWSRFSSSVRARNNLAQVLHDVRNEATLTFDWLFLLLVAAFVAAIGLIENSTVILVASMLISPLMAPITAGTLGTAVKDSSLQQMGVKLEMFGLFLSLVIGFIFGLGICAIDNRYNVIDDWPTYEMTSRCELRSLWVGLLIAIPSGAAVALAVLSEYTASLVGVAISASLLPPAVNAGLLWAMSLVRLIFPTDESRWSVAQPGELALLGTASLCLTLVNIVCVFLAGVAVYKIKEVCPLDTRDIWWWKANKTLMQFSKKVNDFENSNNINIYSNKEKKCFNFGQWSNELVEPNKEPNELKVSPGLIQSDTITYRRPHPNLRRLRAQSIETYCLERAQNCESYIPLDPELIMDRKMFNAENIKEFQNQHIFPKNVINNRLNNSGYDEEASCEDHPTIEPSLTFTVDSTCRGKMIENTCFSV